MESETTVSFSSFFGTQTKRRLHTQHNIIHRFNQKDDVTALLIMWHVSHSFNQSKI